MFPCLQKGEKSPQLTKGQRIVGPPPCARHVHQYRTGATFTTKVIAHTGVSCITDRERVYLLVANTGGVNNGNTTNFWTTRVCHKVMYKTRTFVIPKQNNLDY